jgi:acetate kinase
MDTILVVNAGSSSVKFQVFEVSDRSNLTRLIKGQVDGIGFSRLLKKRPSGPALLFFWRKDR